MKPYTTVPGMVRYVLNTYRNSYAFNWREEGVWKHLATEEFCERVRRVSLGLHEMGIKEGDCIGILSSPSPWWLVVDLAIQIAGGITVPIFNRVSDDNFEFQIHDAKMKGIFVVGQDAWNTLQRSHERLEHVFVHQAELPPQAEATTIDALMKAGDRLSKKDPALFAQLRDRVHEDDVATIIYTSGSTGVPKGVELTQRNFISQVHAAHLRFPLTPKKDVALSLLPMAHVFERTIVYFYLSSGLSIHFVDDHNRLAEFFREVRPTICAVVPRVLEKFHSKMEARLREASFAEQTVGGWAFHLAHGKSESFLATAELAIADKLVYHKFRDAFGGRLRGVICGGAALDGDLCRFFLKIGVPVYQGYGLTETSPVIAANYKGNNIPGTVGKPWPGVEVDISPEGEIITRSSSVMRGYHNNPEATREVIDSDGWFHTGDCGEFDADGNLKVTGRIKEILKTSNGKMVTPIPIEHALSRHPLVDMVMVVAEGKRFVSALFFPDFDFVKKMKEGAGQAHMSHEDFLDSSSVREQIDSLVASVNRELNDWERVKKWRFVPNPVSVEGGELTPTLKIRRNVVLGKYSELVDALYMEEKIEAGEPV